MAISSAKKLLEISDAAGSKDKILQSVGDLSEIDLMFHYVLVCTYIRSTETMLGGKKFYLAPETVKEDQYQSKVGLVLKLGPTAFQDDESTKFHGQKVGVEDWVVYRIGDGWPLNINGVHCRMLEDRDIKLKIKNPDAVY